MSPSKRKKILKGVLFGVGILAIVLTVHIYLVTRPQTINPDKMVMARIDIKNDINQQEANKIQSWLYTQKGVHNALVNKDSKIAIFTFFPAKVSGDQIVSNFKTAFNYDAKRYIPSQEELANSCPAMAGGITQMAKVYIKNIF
jgi:hypothetical protein